MLPLRQEPLFAALIATLLMHERLSAVQLVGGALVISANLVAAKRL